MQIRICAKAVVRNSPPMNPPKLPDNFQLEQVISMLDKTSVRENAVKVLCRCRAAELA